MSESKKQDLQDKDKQASSKKEENDPVKRGQEIIEGAKATTPGSPGQKEKEDKDDAEKWRNEG